MNQRLNVTIDQSSTTRANDPSDRVAFIQSCWHKDIVDQCRDSFLAESGRLGIARRDIDLFEVPGGFEIPLQAQILARSGRYAAIVASEVKSLASQTAKATEEIAAQVAAIQGSTKDSVAAIAGIGDTIRRVSEIATTIASAVEEQGASTQEIARNVQQAAAGTQDVSANIADVTKAANQTGEAAEEVLSAAREMAQQTEALRGEVERFLADVKAA